MLNAFRHLRILHLVLHGRLVIVLLVLNAFRHLRILHRTRPIHRLRLRLRTVVSRMSKLTKMSLQIQGCRLPFSMSCCALFTRFLLIFVKIMGLSFEAVVVTRCHDSSFRYICTWFESTTQPSMFFKEFETLVAGPPSLIGRRSSDPGCARRTRRITESPANRPPQPSPCSIPNVTFPEPNGPADNGRHCIERESRIPPAFWRPVAIVCDREHRT